MLHDTLEIGKIVGAHGIKGEIKVLPITDDPKRLLELKYFMLNGEKYDIISARMHSGCVLFQTEQITDRTRAEIIKGYIEIKREDASPLNEGEYYIADMIGMDIYDTASGKTSKLLDILKTGATPVIEYELEGKNYMIPYLDKYVFEVDIEKGIMKADLSEGV